MYSRSTAVHAAFIYGQSVSVVAKDGASRANLCASMDHTFSLSDRLGEQKGQCSNFIRWAKKNSLTLRVMFGDALSCGNMTADKR
ncbi:hypothetical protein TNCV_732631 [Trichonephila clavipes]|nr:hypothetical protein TNCV_732631 [Trichonephila clavipes]